MEELTDIKHHLPTQEEIKAIQIEDDTHRMRQELALDLSISRQENIVLDHEEVVQIPQVQQLKMKDACYQTESQPSSTKSVS